MRILVVATSFVTAISLIVWFTKPARPLTFALPGSAPQAAIAGTSDSIAEIPELARLEQVYRPATAYWRSDTTAEAQRIEDILAAEQQARAALLAVYGPPARRNARMAALFPLKSMVQSLRTRR